MWRVEEVLECDASRGRADIFFSATVPAKFTARVLDELRASHPLPDSLKHVRRVKKSRDGSVRVLLCRAVAGQELDLDSLPPSTHGIIADVATVPIPLNAPESEEEAARLCETWPVLMRARGPKPLPLDSSEEAAYASRWMDVVRSAAGAAPAADDARSWTGNVALVVDPVCNAAVSGPHLAADVGRGEPMSEARHPLRHACVRAIAHVAELQLAAQAMDGEEGAGCDGHADADDTSAAAGASGRRKRPRGSEGGADGAGRAEAYLLTGLDVFVRREPCVYCCMALTHSRVRRVYFCEPNARSGGLGSTHRIHCLAGLNHHYRAARCVLIGEGSTGSEV